MKTQFLVICLVGVLAACSTDGKAQRKEITSTACDGEVIDGYTRTRVRYGDSYLEVVPVSEVRPFTEFQIELRPRDAGFIGKTITVQGVEVNSWIKGSSDDDSSGDDSSDNQEETRAVIFPVGCAPRDAKEGDEFEFNVVVDGVGILDPRARIVK